MMYFFTLASKLPAEILQNYTLGTRWKVSFTIHTFCSISSVC